MAPLGVWPPNTGVPQIVDTELAFFQKCGQDLVQHPYISSSLEIHLGGYLTEHIVL